jgi:hypothetical protein
MKKILITFVFVSGIVAINVACAPASDKWTLVSSGSKIAGTWKGGNEMEYLTGNNQIPVIRIPFSITIDNQYDPEEIPVSFVFNMNNLQNALSALFPNETVTKDGFRSYFITEDMRIDSARNTLTMQVRLSVEALNQKGRIYVNQRNDRLKVQIEDSKLVGFVNNNFEYVLEKTAEIRQFKLGEFGVAGVVFYDKGFYSDGWRYMEVSLDFTRTTPWSDGSAFIGGLKSEIGEGDYNTRNIINFLGANTAAGAAADYRGGGKDDWYLGNNKEMEICYAAIVKKRAVRKNAEKVPGFVKIDRGLLGDAPKNVWTSEQQTATEAFQLGLVNALLQGGGDVASAKTVPYKFLGMTHTPSDPVRPIRKF